VGITVSVEGIGGAGIGQKLRRKINLRLMWPMGAGPYSQVAWREAGLETRRRK
jgi:hypothetical protein